MRILDELLPGVQHLQNIHPLVVHFPVALLYGATLLYLMAWLLGRQAWSWSALWMLELGALSALAAAASGLYASAGVMVSTSVREHLLNNHMRVMIGVTSLSVVMALWALGARPIPSRGRYLFLFGLVVLIAALTVGADFGGRMVYDYNAGGSACPQPIDFTQ